MSNMKVPPDRVKSDGGSTDYYRLPEGATELHHLMSYKDMSFARGDAFKALYRLGEKDGTDIEYDLRKIEYDVQKMRDCYRKYGRV